MDVLIATHIRSAESRGHGSTGMLRCASLTRGACSTNRPLPWRELSRRRLEGPIVATHNELPAPPLRSVLAERDAAAVAAGGSTTGAEGSGLYRLLVESVRDYAILALDPTGHILTWNAGAERLKGYKPNEVIGRHFSTFYSPEDIAAGKPAMELREAEREGRFEDEGWRLRKDGSVFWANVVLTSLRNPDGTLVGFANVTHDLTERRRAEEALRLSEERFRSLVEGVKDYAIFLLTPDGRIASWNEGAHRIKGYRADEIIGRHFSTFYPAEEAATKPRMELQVAVREGKYEEEGWRVRKDGSLFWASVLITALRTEDGSLLGFAKVTRDLTERRAAQERAIADARRVTEAETSSRTKSEFLASMSHELRTPINATLGYVGLIEAGVGGQIGEQQAEFLARMRRSQEHLLRIINDLLNYSRVEANKIEYEIAPLETHEVVDTVLPLIAPQAQAKGISIEHGPCRGDLVALADRHRLEQIVLNLLANAVKFTPHDGRVRAECSTADAMITISVTDSGPGIAAEHHASIFEPFVQVGRSLTSGHEGTGLGLAISRDLARAMGGDIKVTSALGHGATFTLTLPRSRADAS
jgi:PAS domain S-box-containing protein